MSEATIRKLRTVQLFGDSEQFAPMAVIRKLRTTQLAGVLLYALLFSLLVHGLLLAVLLAAEPATVRERPELSRYRDCCARCHTADRRDARWPLLFDGRGVPLPLAAGTAARVADVWRDNTWPGITGDVNSFERVEVARWVRGLERKVSAKCD